MRMKSIPPVESEDINDDWNRPLSLDEACTRLHRVGNIECPTCGHLYSDHPPETRVVDNEGHPYLVRLCNGWLGKL